MGVEYVSRVPRPPLDGPHETLTLLEAELMRRLCETTGLGLVRHTSSVIAATSGAVACGGDDIDRRLHGDAAAQADGCRCVLP
ncbi:hypothetical protein GCM10027610_059260 [Dactylosporangium cerinum]